MSARPFISLVVPTRNGARLLDVCIRSCLEQSGDGVEVIVSDNASTDETPAVVAKYLADDRLRYQRADSFMPVMADSWEYARRAARGEYQLLVGDDDVLVPRCVTMLERVAVELQPPIISWRSASFDYRPPLFNEEGSILRVRPCTGRGAWAQASSILTGRFGFHHRDVLKPLATNTCYRRDVVETVAQRTGRFFHWPHPDVTSSTMALATTPALLYVDYPLTVGGISSASSVGDLGTKWTSLAREPLVGSQRLTDPLPQLRLYEALWAEAFLRAKAAFPDELGAYGLDLAAVMAALYRELDDYDAQGQPVEDLRAQLDAHMDSLPAGVRMRTRLLRIRAAASVHVASVPADLRISARKHLERTASGRAALQRRSSRRTARTSSHLAQRFPDALEAAHHVDEVIAACPPDVRRSEASFRTLAGMSFAESFQIAMCRRTGAAATMGAGV